MSNYSCIKIAYDVLLSPFIIFYYYAYYYDLFLSMYVHFGFLLQVEKNSSLSSLYRHGVFGQLPMPTTA